MTIAFAMDEAEFDLASAEDEALIEAVVHGDRGKAHDPLVTYLRVMRDELSEPLAPEVQRNHVAAMRRAAGTNGKGRHVRTIG